MNKFKIFLLILGLSTLSYSTLADTWIPCATDTNFLFKKTTDIKTGVQRIITWEGKSDNPDLPWKNISETYRGPQSTSEIVRAEVKPSSAKKYTKHFEDYLWCNYSTDDPNFKAATPALLNLTKLGHKNCVVMQNESGEWGAKCD